MNRFVTYDESFILCEETWYQKYVRLYNVHLKHRRIYFHLMVLKKSLHYDVCFLKFHGSEHRS